MSADPIGQLGVFWSFPADQRDSIVRSIAPAFGSIAPPRLASYLIANIDDSESRLVVGLTNMYDFALQNPLYWMDYLGLNPDKISPATKHLFKRKATCKAGMASCTSDDVDHDTAVSHTCEDYSQHCQAGNPPSRAWCTNDDHGEHGLPRNPVDLVRDKAEEVLE